MAKKWQDVEFVDYKERQRRRRMKKRQQVQEEIVRKSSLRSNLAVIIVAVVFCGSLSAAGLWFLWKQRAVESDARSKMYIEVVESTGAALGRADVSLQYSPVEAGSRRYNGWQYQTPENATLSLKTFDDVSIRLKEGSELTVTGLEVFGKNEGTKSNLVLENGEVVLDSRGRKGLIEIRAGEVTAYARPSLFKVRLRQGRVQVKVSAGGVRVEAGGSRPILGSGQYVSFEASSMGSVQEFNPLAEEW